MAEKLSRSQEELRTLALSYPDACEDFPWGDRCYKVAKKIFFFLGGDAGELRVTVKLPASREMALMLPLAEPTGYGLGKSGWISARFPAGDAVPMPMLREWIDESYRAIAPKRRVAALDAKAPSDPVPAAKPKRALAKPKRPR